MKGKAKALGMFLCLVSLIYGSLAEPIFAAEVPRVTKHKIIIGTISPLTGPIAMVGIPIADAVKDYFSFINEQGGIYGRKIEVISEDDKYEPPQAQSRRADLLATFGSWQDDRAPEEIIEDIYATRTISEPGSNLQ